MLRMITIKEENLPIKEGYNLKNTDFESLSAIDKELKSTFTKEKTTQILQELKKIGDVQRKMLFYKRDSGMYYNLSIDENNKKVFDDTGNIHEMFRQTLVGWECKIKESYSDLFATVNGRRNTKLIFKNKRAIYVNKVLDKFEEIAQLPFMGEVCHKWYSNSGKNFNLDYTEQEYISAKEEHLNMWTQALSKLDSMLGEISDYIDYVTYEKEANYRKFRKNKSN